MNVVYVAIGQHYYDECMISAWSLREIGNYDGRISVLTDDHYVATPEVSTLYGSRELGVDLIQVPPPPSQAHAAGVRLDMLTHLQVEPGERLLYLDCDVIASAPVDFDTLFANVEEGRIGFYGYGPGDSFPQQRNHFMAGFLTTDPEIVSHPGFCTGVMALRNEPETRRFLEETSRRYAELLAADRVNGVWEQPILCHEAIRHGVAALTLTDHVVDRYMAPGRDYTRVVFAHLGGPRDERREEMINLARREYDAEGWHRIIKQ